MDLYPLPPELRPAPLPPGSPERRDYWTALAAEGQVELRHEPPTGATLGYAEPVFETRAGRLVAIAKALGTPAERAAETQRQRRADLVISPFQARAALAQAGLLEAVEALMDDPATPALARLAWQHAQEFRRNSPTLLALTTLMARRPGAGRGRPRCPVRCRRPIVA